MPLRLSILICSLTSRLNIRVELLRLLKNSIGPYHRHFMDFHDFSIERYVGKEAEVVIITDDKQMSVGAKRNLLIESARGEYVAFIDDDDMVTVDYVEELLTGIESQKDVIVFEAVRYEGGKMDKGVIYGVDNLRERESGGFHRRLPNHLMCFKRSIPAKVKYADINYGEDYHWARAVLPYIRSQHRIFKCLYEYWFDWQITETQTR